MLNIRRECELAAKQAEPQNQAEPLPRPKKFLNLFPKIQMYHNAIHNMKGQPGPSTYVVKKGLSKKTVTVKHSVLRT